MKISILPRNGLLLVRIEETDALVQHNAQHLKDAVLKELIAGGPHVLIDCGALKGIDSAGAGALITILKAVHRRGGRMGLVRVAPQVRTTLSVVRLTSVLEIFAKPDTPSRIDAIRDWAERVIGDPGWTTLEVEFAAHARPNDRLRIDLAGRLDGILQMLTTATESAETSGLRLPAREAATILLALGVGLGLLRSIDPQIPVSGLIDTLGLLTGQSL